MIPVVVGSSSYVIYNAFREYLSEGDEIVVTNQDHEANIGVWTRLETAGNSRKNLGSQQGHCRVRD